MHLHDVRPLSVSHLSKSFAGVHAVRDLDIAVPDGTIVGLVGPNGSGKTTTIRTLTGSLAPDAGEILVDGLPHTSRGARSRLAFVPDEPDGFDELAVDEFLALVRALYRADTGTTKRAEALLAAFGLTPRRAVPLGTLSRGMRRQVSMVAALALPARLVVVDEATAALDPEAAIVLREALRVVTSRPAGVLIATQDLHFAETVCDRVVLLSRGACVATGTVETLRREYAAASLEEVFLGALGRAGFVEEVRGVLGSL